MLKDLVNLGEALMDKGSLIPPGYKIYARTSPIRWIIELTRDGRMVSRPEAVEILTKPRPGRRRAGKPSPTNLNPYLLVDEARYVLGIPEADKEEEAELLHEGFVSLLKSAYEGTKASYLLPILTYLDHHVDSDREKLAQIIDPRDVVTFSVGELPYPFERRDMHRFWSEHISSDCSSESVGQCSICGESHILLRILPVQVFILAEGCQITSFNFDAVRSFGRQQTVNAQVCSRCGLLAAQTLNHLLKNEQHYSVIARDSSRGDGGSPLQNQLAVFWLKKELKSVLIDDTEVDMLEVLTSPLKRERGGPDRVITLGLLEEVLGRPWTGREMETNFRDNSFYLAVLSANKARLVIRDWMHTPLSILLTSLERYMQALRIVNPSGTSPRAFSIPAIVDALQSSNPNIVRGLIRTAYSGYMVPTGCLETAVYRMRVGVHSGDRNIHPWRDGGDLHILAGVIKLALTYGTKEAKTMEQLDANARHVSQGYLCGRLLAILEEIQKRAARYRLNTTLTERYIGAASTSPGTTFPGLIRLAESGHLPKIRKEHMGYVKMRDLMQEVCAGIDGSGGFPSVLSLREQAEFMLGFYHQRAQLEREREEARARRIAESQEDIQLGGVHGG
ncbi:MAG: type I-C CRISPR-associated protein Cas8c/Csd1 [Firmicutes bacterium]|nr:type I-C CRISPR-associated protein Cas8c/Csd1 [Bacillota bacterium]